MMRRLALLALVAGCGEEPVRIYPRDAELTVWHLQAEGSHNSYHVETFYHPPYAYTHAPLAEQLGRQGVRQFELDLWPDENGAGHFAVMHAPIIDEGTTCARLVECLAEVDEWSSDHPWHHPIMILIEGKTPHSEETGEAWFSGLDADILAAFPRERLLTPADVRGDAATLREAINTRGWPTLGATRGKVILVLLEGPERRDAYPARGEGLLFPTGGLGDPWAGVALVDDPVGGGDQIRRLVEAGFLVRTRADADLVEPTAGDMTRLQAALASGAQFISTDVPAPAEGMAYFVTMPGGTPSRCNPITAPAGCGSTDIE